MAIGLAAMGQCSGITALLADALASGIVMVVEGDLKAGPGALTDCASARLRA